MGLEVKDVNKNFGTKHAVNNLSFTIDKPGAFRASWYKWSRKNNYN
jgi:ABC-type sugar transport system ATPase subunit